jgi:tetratricopeptide (TPR) repeat protein
MYISGLHVFLVKLLKHNLYFLFLLLSVSALAKPNSREIDSLKSTLQSSLTAEHTANDTSTINNLNKLANDYVKTSPDSAIYYYEKAIGLSRIIQYNRGIADGLVETGDLYYGKGNYEVSKRNLEEALVLYNKLHDLIGVSDCYKVYANLYEQTGEYEKSLVNFNRFLNIKIRINDEPGLAKVYLGMGNVYSDNGHPSTALDYYFKSLFLNTKLHNKSRIAASDNNIGTILQGMEIFPKPWNITLKHKKHGKKYIALAELQLPTKILEKF